MDKKFQKTLGISLIASAITLFVSLTAFADGKKKNTSFFGFLAVVGGLLGLFLVKNPELPMKKEESKETEELFDEADLDNIGSVMNAELSHTNDGEDTGAPRLNLEIPRDDEASEADFT